MNNTFATITLIGSGEFGEGMGRVYREILSRAPAQPNAVFLDTPAGFELNADAIATKAADYFSQRLSLPLQIAGFKHSARATALELEAALRTLYRADFIFAGPGSPSYAIRHWHNTPLWEAVLRRFENGAHLVFASAAAIAVSKFALPVYEIYKAGDDLFWLEGMDLLSALGMKLAIVPHWNNTEGGTYDTRFCYMGETRFRELERQLASDVIVVGIDEYTACLFDLETQECRVMGAGKVTIRCDGQEWVYEAGQKFPFARLRGGIATANRTEPEPEPVLANTAESSDEVSHYLMQVARALDQTQEPQIKRDLIDRAHDTMHEMSADRLDASHTASDQDLAPFLETFIEIRRELRAAKQFALADEIRKRLAALNIVLEDSASGTTWRKVNP